MSEYRPPLMAVTVDVAVFTERKGRKVVALIKRGNQPYQGAWALPGGFVELDEDLPMAASRELAEETGIEIPPSALTQVGAYGDPARDPRMRVVTIAFRVFASDVADPVGASDAATGSLVPIDVATAPEFDLAFDHHIVLADAIEAAGL